MMAGILAGMKARGAGGADDVTIGGHLLRLRQPSGQPLPDDRLAAEVGVFFTGGFETTGHTIAWALCGPPSGACRPAERHAPPSRAKLQQALHAACCHAPPRCGCPA